MSRSTAEGVGFVCNCDRWHCGAVKTALCMSKPGYPKDPKALKEAVAAG
jgi:hypothetical protein